MVTAPTILSPLRLWTVFTFCLSQSFCTTHLPCTSCSGHSACMSVEVGCSGTHNLRKPWQFSAPHTLLPDLRHRAADPPVSAQLTQQLSKPNTYLGNSLCTMSKAPSEGT